MADDGSYIKHYQSYMKNGDHPALMHSLAYSKKNEHGNFETVFSNPIQFENIRKAHYKKKTNSPENLRTYRYKFEGENLIQQL